MCTGGRPICVCAVSAPLRRVNTYIDILSVIFERIFRFSVSEGYGTVLGRSLLVIKTATCLEVTLYRRDF